MVTLFIDSDFNDYMELEGEAHLMTSTTTDDGNIVIVDEEQGLDIIYGEPNEELKQKLIEPVEKGFTFFTALFIQSI